MANFVFDDVLFDDAVLVNGLRIIPLIALLASTLYFLCFSFDPRHPPLEPSGETNGSAKGGGGLVGTREALRIC